MSQIAVWCIAALIALFATLSAIRYDVSAWVLSLWNGNEAQTERELAAKSQQQPKAEPSKQAAPSAAARETSLRPEQQDKVEQPEQAPTAQRKEAIAEATQQPEETTKPKFDVVRIDPQGASVFAGRAPANSTVTVLANDKAVASAKADENGAWATVIERQFAAGDYQLQLSSKPGEADGQSVSISIAGAPTATAKPQAVAAAKPQPVKLSPPKPITFVYDEAVFTPEGERAARALTDYLRTQNLDTVMLSGHADERGSQPYNMELSRQRLEAVQRYLRENGFTGQLVLVPKGKSEPYTGIDRATLPRDKVFQLDRRVELHLTN